METTLGLSSTDISIIQLITTLIGGFFAIYLFLQSNSEKRQSLILSICDRLYNDVEIRSAIYAADKNIGLEKIEKKLQENDITTVSMEMEVDKTLRYLNLVGIWIRSRKLQINDIMPFEYEVKVFLRNPIIKAYQSYLKSLEVNFIGIDYLYAEILQNDKSTTA